MVPIILKYGANIETKDNDGRRPIHVATNQGEEILLNLLLSLVDRLEDSPGIAH